METKPKAVGWGYAMMLAIPWGLAQGFFLSDFVTKHERWRWEQSVDPLTWGVSENYFPEKRAALAARSKSAEDVQARERFGLPGLSRDLWIDGTLVCLIPGAAVLAHRSWIVALFTFAYALAGLFTIFTPAHLA